MNISYKWLKQYLATEMSPDEISSALTSIGLEVGTVEKVESIRGGLKGIVVGKVLTCIPHPDSDHLHITTVDLGGEEPETIVCGAPNVAAGQTVMVATVGTVLYDKEGNSFQIKKSKIRGQQSMGMICAEDEIGVGTSHDGIIVLDGDNLPSPGTPAAEYYKLEDDYVIEVDLTPNRIDAASHYGVARDLAAWILTHQGKESLSRPSVEAFKSDDPGAAAITVEVADPEACPRYCGITIRGVEVKESPEWLKTRLSTIGMHPINNIVDITNYVLHGIGQPLHCFDCSKIKGDKIVVRPNAEDVKFVTLDGVERTVGVNDLMICNAEAPMCVAGVFGGLDSGVTTETKDVFIESACFHPTWIRKTARRLGLNTDASFRYERGVDPNGCMYALKFAALLIKELAGGAICGEPVDVYPVKAEPFKVELHTDYLNRLLGHEIPSETIDAILKGLEIKTVKQTENCRSLEVPTYRVDVQRPCDVAEDLLRIYGYNNVPMPQALHASLSFKTPTDAVEDERRVIAEQLTGAGYNEILNNSLTAEGYYANLETYPLKNCVKLLNPLSQDLDVMRQTLLFGGLETIGHNANRRNPDLKLYEFGNVYLYNSEAIGTTGNDLAPYSEGSRLAIWITGDKRPKTWLGEAEKSSYFDLSATTANIFARLGINPGEIVTESMSDDILASGLVIKTRNGKVLGHEGVISPKLASAFEIKNEVYYAEFDWKALTTLSLKRNVTYSPLPKTHPVKRDLSLLIDKGVTMAQVKKTVTDSERKLIKDVTLFDVYEGDKLPEGKKSYAISITLQDAEKTLQDKQIEAVMKKVVANLTRQLGAELR